MSKALFTHSYFYPLDKKQWRFKQPYPPLMTIQAAAVAREMNLEVGLFDSGLKNNPSEIKSIIENQEPQYLILVDDGFNYLTKMCLSVMREAAFSMIQIAKAEGCVVLVNSSDASDHFEKYLNVGADYIIRGEVEETLKELLTALENDTSVESIPGTSYRLNNHITSNPNRSVLKELDTLPMPAWNLVDIDSYRNIWKKYHGYFSLNIATTRGCPYKCNWCAKPIYGNRYNSRSPEHVVNEIEYLVSEYQPDHFWMCDDIFGLKPGWIREFDSLLKSRQIKIKYKIQSRVDLLLEENTIDSLKSSGAETVWVGAESGSQKILDAMDKGTTIEQIKTASSLLKQKGIRVAHFLQFGYLGETKEDIKKTLALMLEVMPDEIGISVSYPLPGTRFHEKVKQMMSEKQNWSDSDDLAMMFENQYGSRFYKILHRYVHNRYRIQRGLNQLKDSITLSRKSVRYFLSMIYNIPMALINRFQLHRLSKAQ